MTNWLVAFVLAFILLTAEGVDRIFFRQKRKKEEAKEDYHFLYDDDDIPNSQYFKDLNELYIYIKSQNTDKYLESALKNTIDKGFKITEPKKHGKVQKAAGV